VVAVAAWRRACVRACARTAVSLTHSCTHAQVRLLMVDGDWRVAVYANRSITPNEELFYDYRYDQDVRPDWANGDA
jgi:hypothetical protein